MKLRLIAVALAATTLVSAPALAQDTSTEKGQLSYALGYDLGRNAIETGESLDVEAIVKGLRDGYSRKDPAVPVEQLRTAVQNMQQRQAAKARAEWEKASAENKTRSDAFVAENRGKAGVQVLPGGAQYRILETGNGAKPTANSTVQLEIAGPFPWGQRPEGQAAQARPTPAMPMSQIELPAMREALMQMPAGSKWEITLAPEQAYGADPRTGFPPNVAVQFEIKLVSVQ